MSDEFATLNLDKLPNNEFRSNDQMRRHSVDKSLENKPIERALHILMVGEEIQKLSVIQSIPNLLATDVKGCIQKVIPKMNQGLLQGSTEYHMTASAAVRSVVGKKLISPDLVVQNFLSSVLSYIDSRDAEVSRAWFETLLDVITVLPISVIHREILPTAVTKADMSKPIVQRLMSCKMLGRIAQSCDAYVLKKDVFPLVQALTQDTSKAVRSAICMELPTCAAILSSSIDKDILPMLNELANDEECVVKVAAFQTMVDIMQYLTPDTMKNVIVPLAKKMIDAALFPSEDEMKVVITKNYGKICLGFEKVMLPSDKTWMLDHFSKLAQLGLPQMKFKDRIVQKPQFRSPHTSSMYLECRLNCAYNIPAILVFSSDLDSSVINTIYPIICDLTSDPYFMVRRSIGAGIHEVTRILGQDNGVVITELIKLLKDDAEEVLQGVVPNLKATMESFCSTKTLSPDLVDETAIELARALLKCEAEIANMYDWRLHSKFLEQLEVLPKCLPSDFIYSQFVPLVFKRLFSSRAVPCRLAAVRTLLVFLRYNLKPSQRSEIRNKIINDLCCSPNFYDRMIYVKSCQNIIDVFSSVYVRDFFFAKTLQLMDDKVPNIRRMAYTLIPQLKIIARGAEKQTIKFTHMIDSTIRIASAEKDRDAKEVVISITQKIDKMGLSPFKPDAKDMQKFEEEKYLATLTGGKEWKTQLTLAPSVGPIGGRVPGGGVGGGSNNSLRDKRSDYSRAPLSSSVSRVDGPIRSSSAPPPSRDLAKSRSTASSQANVIRSPNSSQSLMQSNNRVAAGSPASGVSASVASAPSLSLPSASDDNRNENQATSNGTVHDNDDNDNNNNSHGNCKNDNDLADNLSSDASKPIDANFKIPVRRYQSNKLNRLVSPKSRRHSSFGETQSDNGRIEFKGFPSYSSNSNVIIEIDNNNNNNNKKKLGQLPRRPHSMTTLLTSANKTCHSAAMKSSAASTPISRLPIRKI